MEETIVPEEQKPFSVPIKLPKKSPMRFLSVDKLEQGEEILPKNFILVFSPYWHSDTKKTVSGLYDKIIPTIGISGRAVFLNSKYQNSKLEKFLIKQRRE